MKAKDKIRITVAKINFTRTAKYTWKDYKRNEDIYKILRRKTDWIQHADRMQRDTTSRTNKKLQTTTVVQSITV
jgi:hypothetical protein